MTDIDIIKKEEEKLGKCFVNWSKLDKINFIINNNYKDFSYDIDQLILKLNNHIDNVIRLNDDASNQEYCYITFNELIKLMENICNDNLKDIDFKVLKARYHKYKEYFYEETIIWKLDALFIRKENDHISISTNYEYNNKNFCFGLVKKDPIRIYRNNDKKNYYLGGSIPLNVEQKIISLIDCDKLYSFFNNSDANIMINGIYANNGIKFNVPIKVNDTSVLLCNGIHDTEGIGYYYSISDYKVIKVFGFMDNDLKALYTNDSNYKNNILININDLPNQYLKYLDTLHTDKNKKGKFIKIKSRFDHKKNS